MNFRKITDDLFATVTHDDLARALGVSVATVRQARLGEAAKARRSPPPGWQKATLRLAEAQMRHFDRLIQRIHKASQEKA